MRPSVISLAIVAACATPERLPPVWFANAPPVRAVNDRQDVRTKPEERLFLLELWHYDGIVQRRLSRALELPRDRRALGVNAIDEVPDSTWFTNRIGVRRLSLDEMRAGPATIESPELHKPWTIRSTKVGGSEVGFMMTDARGIKFMIKFDSAAHPEQDTATHLIVDKLLWACGFNTTEDFLVRFSAADVVLAPDAVIKHDDGHKTKLDRAELERRLAHVEHDSDGTIRALASRWLAGKPLGGHPPEGVRDDDPNDRIPHELRRDLRGFYTMAAWLDHVDIQESNFLDMWVEDRKDPKRHYVMHYMLDFGMSLGVMAASSMDPRHGFDYVVDFAEIGRSLFTAGAIRRSWEARESPGLRGVGLFDASSFDPGSWKPDSPAYVPFLTADRFDKFWGAKIVMRFTREQIRAVVESVGLSDPRSVDYLTDTLVARQRATGLYWFTRVNPLDRFAVVSKSVCFDDLMLVYGFGAAAETQYTVTAYDRSGRPLGDAVALRGDRAGYTCTGPVPTASSDDGYTIIEISTTRPGFSGRTLVHLARDPATALPRLIGIWRP
jgi:hypothetical protein